MKAVMSQKIRPEWRKPEPGKEGSKE